MTDSAGFLLVLLNVLHQVCVFSFSPDSGFIALDVCENLVV